MKPLYERVLVKPKDKETRTKQGIMLPEKAVKKPNIGTVVSTGDGTKHNEMVVKPGDQILFNRYAGLELMFKGEKHYVIMANEIIGVLDDINDISLEEFE
ncbi:GroS Co-chaperonin GroES (HSP10) [uncultured Caudovirales phage]|jgi:chaperonin GroES|uniref:GroS Co-chaperonin GroES (HSP10) n=1 Tax=uncultured Caudovirales phage TaxID=2100421 RepID=A0A6J5PUV8_9CAUD|nr:GroS Co-chaperonin GroES (HSP10) [uncultured Caudovirales phage]